MDTNPEDKEENTSESAAGEEGNPNISDVPLSSNNSSTKSQESSDDPMLGFLTLLAKVERPSCANCELKDVSPMFYCNTCGKFLLCTIRKLQNYLLFLMWHVRCTDKAQSSDVIEVYHISFFFLAQAICSVCKKNTHSAKMFSRHDISSVSPYTREPQRKVKK